MLNTAHLGTFTSDHARHGSVSMSSQDLRARNIFAKRLVLLGQMMGHPAFQATWVYRNLIGSSNVHADRQETGPPPLVHKVLQTSSAASPTPAYRSAGFNAMEAPFLHNL